MIKLNRYISKYVLLQMICVLAGVLFWKTEYSPETWSDKSDDPVLIINELVVYETGKTDLQPLTQYNLSLHTKKATVLPSLFLHSPKFFTRHYNMLVKIKYDLPQTGYEAGAIVINFLKKSRIEHQCSDDLPLLIG